MIATAAALAVIFAVHGPAGDSAFIEPVAFVDHGRFSKPPEPIESFTLKKATSDSFAGRYYRKGTRYRVFRGGANAGVATVGDLFDAGCFSLAAKVTLTKPIEKGIAVGSLDLPERKTAPREPTEAEYQKLYKIAGRAFARRGVPASLFDQMESGRVVATDINNDGQTDYIGDFEVTDKAKKVEHRLFLITTGFTPDYVWYHRGNLTMDQDTDLLTLIDHAHFGGSEFDQVIVQRHGYEGWDYRILQRDRSGKWQVVFEGGGSGC